MSRPADLLRRALDLANEYDLDLADEIEAALDLANGPAAYDGSTHPAKRFLTPLERDLMVRVIRDMMLAVGRGQAPEPRIYRGDLSILEDAAVAIDPRN